MSKTDNNRALSPPRLALASLADIIAALLTYRVGTIPSDSANSAQSRFITIFFVALRHFGA